MISGELTKIVSKHMIGNKSIIFQAHFLHAGAKTDLSQDGVKASWYEH